MKIFRETALIAGLLCCAVSGAVAQSIEAALPPRIQAAREAQLARIAQRELEYAPVLAEIRPLAEAGDPEAQTNLGDILFDIRHYDEGASWHLRAAQQGYAEAQHRMWGHYKIGVGVPLDLEQGMHWLRRAANQDYEPAMYSLGEAYRQGEGVPRDLGEAWYWFLLCAEQGSANCQYQLGMMSEYGNGVPMNFVLAYMWYNIAAASDHFLATPSRDSISEQMSQAQIAEAQALSSRCFEQNYQNCGR